LKRDQTPEFLEFLSIAQSAQMMLLLKEKATKMAPIKKKIDAGF